MARSTQEQQQLVAAMTARDNVALFQIYQRYAHDPAMLQRQLNAYLSMSASKSADAEVACMMDASHLVYHFASKIFIIIIIIFYSPEQHKQTRIITVEYKNMLEGCHRSKRSLNWPPILYNNINNINTNDKKKWFKGVTFAVENIHTVFRKWSVLFLNITT